MYESEKVKSEKVPFQPWNSKNWRYECFVHEIYFLWHQPGLTAVDQLKLLTIYGSGVLLAEKTFISEKMIVWNNTVKHESWKRTKK